MNQELLATQLDLRIDAIIAGERSVSAAGEPDNLEECCRRLAGLPDPGFRHSLLVEIRGKAQPSSFGERLAGWLNSLTRPAILAPLGAGALAAVVVAAVLLSDGSDNTRDDGNGGQVAITPTASIGPGLGGFTDFSPVGAPAASYQEVLAGILDGGGYAEGSESRVVYERDNVAVATLFFPGNPPGSEFLNMFRFIKGDDGLWVGYPGYDAANDLYATPEDALIAFALKNQAGIEIGGRCEDSAAGAFCWALTSESPEMVTYTLTLADGSQQDVEIIKEGLGWKTFPYELFPHG